MSAPQGACPVSWKARVNDLPPNGRAVAIRASQADRGAIAYFAGLAELRSFEADLVLAPLRRAGVRVRGSLRAAFVQTCIVSLLPVEASLDIEVQRSFAPEAPRRRPRGKAEEERELVIAFDEQDPPEPLTGNEIDLAEILLEDFMLALDPYPRHPDAIGLAAPDKASGEAPDEAAKGGSEPAERGPFAGLEALRHRKKEPKT